MRRSDVTPGSRWRNRRSGAVSEVTRVTGTSDMLFDVYFKQGKGERKKFGPHLELDYELVRESADPQESS